MGKRIALVTGATGGIGREFTQLLINKEIDELWAIARNEEKLNQLRDEMGERIVVLPVDLSKREGLTVIERKLHEEQATITYLLNNAGIAKMGTYDEFDIEEIQTTINLNCTAIITLCRICIPFMQRGSKILNISSASAFQPTPYLNLYAATKAFELSYSRALNTELRGTGISVCAVCPSWVDTELLVREVNGRTVSFPGLVTPLAVAQKALRDADKGRALSVYPLYAKYLHVAAKCLPQRLIMHTWLRMLKHYQQ